MEEYPKKPATGFLNGILWPLLPRKMQPYSGKLGYVAVRRYSERATRPRPIIIPFPAASGSSKAGRGEGGVQHYLKNQLLFVFRARMLLTPPATVPPPGL